MKKHSILIAILVFVAFSFGSFSIQNGHDLFQKALAKERAEGNLEEAICLYQKLVDETKDEALAAKAQYRIGICFEKLGLEKTKSAQEAFQKVMDNYPHQIEIVKLAQERLSSLLNAKAAAEKRDSEFILKKIGPGNTRGQGEVSPDGRYISFTDWNTGDLVVQDLIKREKYNITHKGSWEKSGAMAYSSRWSPDGGSIAYDWWDWDTEPNFVGIRIASRDGTKIRTLFQVSPDEGVSVTCGWSPDGKYIMAVIKREQSPTSSQIVLISVNDGSKRVLKTYYEKNEPEKAAFSPDGKHIILERRQADNPTNNDVFLLSMKSGEEIPLITHTADDRFLASAPDGEHILFLSDRRGTRDVWLLQMEGDEIKGTPRLIKEGLGDIEPLGCTNDGSFYYILPILNNEVYVTSFNPINKDMIEIPKQPIEYIGKSSHSPAYSPDGKYLAFISVRGTHAKSRLVICLRNLETEKEQDFYPGHVNLKELKWSPDSRFLLVRASDRPVTDFGTDFFNYMICKVDTLTGRIETVFQSEVDKNRKINRIIYSIDWAIDGKSIYYVMDSENEKSCQLIKRNLQTGAEETLYRTPINRWIFYISRSPDGKWITFTGSGEKDMRSIYVVSTEGGEPREVFKYKREIGYIHHCGWTSDGKYILFTKPRKDFTELWCVPLFGGEPQNLGLKMSKIYHLSAHDDGRHIAFNCPGPNPPKAEIWMMRNFLPEIETEGERK